MPSDIDGEKKTIDIDDKGPGAEVIFPEEKQAEEKESNETIIETIENDTKPDDASEKSDKPVDVRDEKNEGGEVEKEAVEEGSDKQSDNSKAVEEYSEGVKKRIAKLTKKMS